MGESKDVNDVDVEMMANVLSRLPVVDVLRCGCVCKRWNELVESLNVVRFKEYSFARPYCCRIREDCTVLELVNYGLDRCHRLSLEFLSSQYEHLEFLGSGGGILLFCNDVGRYIVSNPVTKAWRELPPMLPPPAFSNSNTVSIARIIRQGTYVWPPLGSFSLCDPGDLSFQRPCFAAIVPDRKNRSYRILLAGFKDVRVTCLMGCTYDYTTRIYDSSTNTWSIGGLLPERGNRYFSGGASCHDLYYGIVNGIFRTPEIIVYDWVSQGWSNLQAKLPWDIVQPQLVEHNGNLLVVGWHPTSPGEPKSVKISLLSESRLQWEDYDRVPLDAYISLEMLDRRRAATVRLECIGRGDLLYFSEEKNRPVLVYDIPRKEWSRVLVAGDLGLFWQHEKQLFDPTPQSP